MRKKKNKETRQTFHFSLYFHVFLARRSAIWTHGDLFDYFLCVFFDFGVIFLKNHQASIKSVVSDTNGRHNHVFRVETTQNETRISYFQCTGTHFMIFVRFMCFFLSFSGLFFWSTIGSKALLRGAPGGRQPPPGPVGTFSMVYGTVPSSGKGSGSPV